MDCVTLPGFITNYHTLGGFKQQKWIFSQPGDDGRDRTMLPWKVLEEDPALPPLASDGGQPIPGLACGHKFQFLPLPSRGLPPCAVLGPNSPLPIRTPVTGFTATLIQYDLILTSYICRDCPSQEGHILSGSG